MLQNKLQLSSSEGRWEVMEVWNEYGRNVSWWLIAWFKFHGALHPLGRPSFYTACLIPGECHCHSEAVVWLRAPAKENNTSQRQGIPLSSPSPQSPALSSLITPGCLSVRPVGRQGINISGSLPPTWGSGDHYGRQYQRLLNASIMPGTVRACDVLTSLSGHPCSWPGASQLVPLPDVASLVTPGPTHAGDPAQPPVSIDSRIRIAGLETQSHDLLAA